MRTRIPGSGGVGSIVSFSGCRLTAEEEEEVIDGPFQEGARITAFMVVIL